MQKRTKPRQKEIESREVFLSQCCEAPCFASYGEEGTNCFVCSVCHNACDWKVVNIISYTANPQLNLIKKWSIIEAIKHRIKQWFKY